MLGYDWMLLTSTCLRSQPRALVVFKALHWLKQTQGLLQGDGKHEVQTHSCVLGPITQHTLQRESRRFTSQSSPVYTPATCGNTDSFRDEAVPNGTLTPVSSVGNYFHLNLESLNTGVHFLNGFK